MEEPALSEKRSSAGSRSAFQEQGRPHRPRLRHAVLAETGRGGGAREMAPEPAVSAPVEESSGARTHTGQAGGGGGRPGRNASRKVRAEKRPERRWFNHRDEFPGVVISRRRRPSQPAGRPSGGGRRVYAGGCRSVRRGRAYASVCIYRRPPPPSPLAGLLLLCGWAEDGCFPRPLLPNPRRGRGTRKLRRNRGKATITFQTITWESSVYSRTTAGFSFP